MKETGISLVYLLFSLAAAASPGPVQTMRQAGELYEQGDHDRAIRLWEGLREAGYASGALFYNLGNAYLETGRLGKAVLNYERAYLLQPGKAEIRHNLRLAMGRVEGEPLSWPESVWTLRWRALRGMLSSNSWALAGLAACWGGLAALWASSRRREKRGPWLLAAAAGGLLAIFAWTMAFGASRALASHYSVVMEERLPVRVGPDEQSGELAVAFEGWKVKRLDRIGGWIKVELADGQEGWAPESGLESL